MSALCCLEKILWGNVNSCGKHGGRGRGMERSSSGNDHCLSTPPCPPVTKDWPSGVKLCRKRPNILRCLEILNKARWRLTRAKAVVGMVSKGAVVGRIGAEQFHKRTVPSREEDNSNAVWVGWAANASTGFVWPCISVTTRDRATLMSCTCPSAPPTARYVSVSSGPSSPPIQVHVVSSFFPCIKNGVTQQKKNMLVHTWEF